MKRAAVMALVAVAAFGSVAAVQHRLDAVRAAQRGEELLYLPNQRLLEHFTAGMSGVIADLLWIRCLLYTGEHFRGDHDFTWLNHMCETATRLDPYFVDAYRYGGIFLAMLKADDEACIRLLEKGMAHNPGAWQLPYEVAMTYLLNRPSQPDSQQNAARYLAMAIKTGNAPPFVLQLAESLHSGQNMIGLERDMWESMRNSEDILLRDLSERKLILIELRIACQNLDKAAARYHAERGVPPIRIENLVAAGLVPAAPHDPFGGSFFIDTDGRAKNSTVLDGQVERGREILRGGIGAYRDRNGRWPASLDELAASGTVNPMPPHPYAARQWQYDPATGNVE